MSSPPRSVGIVGGGTAGYFTALALKRRFPQLEVTLIESSSIPIIGVGEATTTLMPPFLYHELGLDIVELHRTVKPTFKLGIEFEWGLPGDHRFAYPFGESDPIDAFAYDGHLENQSLVSLMMRSGRAPIVRGPDGRLLSLLPSLKFAYHLDNAPFVAFLKSAAARAGIHPIDVTIDRAVPRADGSGVEALHTADGRELRFDLYVDASGFRSLLLEKTLGSPFQSYAKSLFCDRAIVAEVPQRGGIQPYTTAETMDAGWCWRIPMEGEDHRGYVHASAFIDEASAIAEMRAKNPGMGEPRVVRFRSGRLRDFWWGNTVGVGNAYGFVEPLESTALHMVIIEVAYLLAGIEAMSRGESAFPSSANEAVGAHWDYLRWFLSVHYRFNRRLETPFWRAARADVDVSGLRDVIARFRAEGPWRDDGKPFGAGNPGFRLSGLMVLLLGQGVAAPPGTPSFTPALWARRVDKLGGLAERGLPHGEALAVLRDRPEMLVDCVNRPGSWCHGGAERFVVPGPRLRQ